MKIFRFFFVFFVFIFSSSFLEGKSLLQKEIIGTWNCIDLGDIENDGFSLPSEITFYSNGKFSEILTYHSSKMLLKGTYKISQEKNKTYIVFTVSETEGTGSSEYTKIINRTNASGLGSNNINSRFPIAQKGGKNTGPIKITYNKLYMSVYLDYMEPRPENFKGARKYERKQNPQ